MLERLSVMASALALALALVLLSSPKPREQPGPAKHTPNSYLEQSPNPPKLLRVATKS